MKRIILTLSLAVCMQTLTAQVFYYKGEWTTTNTSMLFSGIFRLQFNKDHTVKGQLVWTYLASDSTDSDMMDLYKGKKGMAGIEYVSGTFDRATRSMTFQGNRKVDPHEVIGTDIYTLKISADNKYIYGNTDDHGSGKGLFFARKVVTAEGKKEFILKKKRIVRKKIKIK